MPVRAPRVCGLCGGVHQYGERCAKAVARDRERKARHDAKRPSRHERGYDNDWQQLRAAHLIRQPYCARCGATATTVDHVIPIRKAPERRLDPTNLQSLCTACHSGWKQAKERKIS